MRGDGPGTAREARIREPGRMGPPSPRRAPGPVPGRLHRPGPASPGALRLVHATCEAGGGIAIAGNHEEMLLWALDLEADIEDDASGHWLSTPQGYWHLKPQTQGLACRVAGPRRGGPGKAGGGSRRRGTWARRRTEPAHAHRCAVGTEEGAVVDHARRGKAHGGATAVPKMPVDGRCEDVIFFDGVFFEPSLTSIFFAP